jgi:ABC transport system ATP-binding/permease protein
MNQTTLKSIMRLFALVRQFNSTPNVDLSVREAVTVFLNDYTSTTEAHEIINIFNYHCDTLAKRESSAKLLSLLSVKSTIICSSIVGNLTKQTRIHIALIVLDILAAGRKLDLESFDLVRTIGTIFQLLSEEMKDIIAYANVDDKSLSENVLLVSAKKSDKRFTKHICEPQLTGEIVFLYNRITHSIFFKHIGAKELLIRNGNLIKHNRTYLLGKGGIIENYKISSLFYGKLQSHFSKNNDEEKLLIEVKNISYRFPDGVMAIHPLSFNVQSSEMVGVLGNSGAGKTTLLNLLAGNHKPLTGKFLINGNDWYSLGDERYSLLGFIPQDDLLIKELTVFQNLYFAARLSLKGKSELETAKIVLRTLDELGLSEIKRFKVGTPERSIISGGQRKRLNLALELVRNPPILLVDEPTSGLASTDSERIIDIIKRKTQSGAIALVNIHQPSSDIFKVFDRILLLDSGGRAVFFGNPIDALVHLKTVTSQVDSTERQCFACGNVNPEQILSIIEQRKLKADGMPTEQRLFQPEWWYEQYNETANVKEDSDNIVRELPKSNLRRASRIQQLKIYFNRNVLSMITDRQFLAISLLEAPTLALLLAFLSKHFGEHNESAYTLFHNQNIPAYLLMSIIVAMFFGLMIGAERIIREKHIVSRESFLGLSRLSYINSKLVCLFLVLSIQVTLYLLIGNLILGICDGWFNMWIILFSIAFNAGVLALNLSSGLRSSVAIYISIPILLMPQLLLNGSLIPFDKLHRSIASHTNVPSVANMAISRWGYEALVVNQFTSSNYNKIYSQIDRAGE